MREMNAKEMEAKLSELKLELSRERATSEIGGMLKSPGKIREIRRTIARIHTLRNTKKRILSS